MAKNAVMAGSRGLSSITGSVMDRGQRPATPFGVPTPVGPSQPVPARHHCVTGQLPVDPEVTSLKLPVCEYGSELANVDELPVLPESAYMAAISGEDRLVPPYCAQDEAVLLVGA